MKIDTEFGLMDEVYYMLSDRIQGGIIKEINIFISKEYEIIPTIVYKMTDGVNLTNPRILCKTKKEVAERLLNL